MEPNGSDNAVESAISQAGTLQTPADASNFLANEAASLFNGHDFTNDVDFRNAAVGQLIQDNVLPSLLWSEQDALDTNQDHVIDQDEASAGMQSGELFKQLASTFVQGYGPVTFDDIASWRSAVPDTAPAVGADTPPPYNDTSALPVPYSDQTIQDPNYAQFTGDSTGSENTESSNPLPYDITTVRPTDAQSPQPDSADMTALTAPNSSTEDRLKAIKNLVESGQTSATLTDADGQQFNVRMEEIAVPGSSRTMVQMIATDPATGKEHPVLRAISDGDAFLHQRDANGYDVDFEGDWWKANRPNSMFGVATANQTGG